MKTKFYLYEGEVWKSNDRSLRFVNVSDPEKVVKYASANPDTVERFVEVKPNQDTYVKDAPQEKLYRVLTDTSTVIYLNEESFRDISKNVSAYLQEIEEWERMCVIRDIAKFYHAQRLKKKAEIEDYIKHHNKSAANRRA
jgi:hypothetical protein